MYDGKKKKRKKRKKNRKNVGSGAVYERIRRHSGGY